MSPDVVVVGAGVIGASCAFHLARAGLRVVVLDRAAAPGAGSTGRATGGFRAQFATAINIRLSLLARAELARFRDDTGVDPGLDPVGYLFLAGSTDELAALRTANALQQREGLTEARIVDAADVAAINPHIDRAGIVGAAWSPSDGTLRPLDIARGYLEAAMRSGVEVRWSTPVLAIETTMPADTPIARPAGPAAARVITPAGPISTPLPAADSPPIGTRARPTAAAGVITPAGPISTPLDAADPPPIGTRARPTATARVVTPAGPTAAVPIVTPAGPTAAVPIVARAGPTAAVRVVTPAGSISTPLVVDAAGAWAAAVAALAGVALPVTPLRRQVALTAPTTALPARFPMTIWLADGFHLRVRDGRVLLLRPTPGDPADPWNDQVEPAWLDTIAELAPRRVPALAGLALDRAGSWAGLYEMSPDGHALLGFAAPHLLVANGSSGHGVMHAPALGRLVAELATGATPSLDVHALRPSRFAEGAPIAGPSLL